MPAIARPGTSKSHKSVYALDQLIVHPLPPASVPAACAAFHSHGAMGAEKQASAIDGDFRRACEHFIVVASELHRAGRFTWTWNMRGTAHNTSYKAVLVRFDFIDFASKLVYQREQECAVQVAPLFSLNVVAHAGQLDLNQMINILLTTVLFSSFSLPTVAQILDCNKLKEGTFKIEGQGSGLTLITRTGDIQREENPEYKVITEDKIEWIDDCTYRLIPYRVIKNESGLDMTTDMKLEIHIFQIKEDSYIQRTTSRLTGQSLEAEVKIIKN